MMGSNKMPSFGIFILTTLLVFTEAGPVNKLISLNTCAVQCSGNHKFGYQPGTIYEFSYDAKTTTKMNGASEDSAMIDMTAKVEFEPITKCDLVMKIKDASLRDSEDDQNSQAFKEAMMKQPLKFSFQDGRIDHICAMDEESTWTLNIKRGILSAFQNSMDSFDRNQNVTETDVVGSCDAEYKILDDGRRAKVVEKTKNLLGCSDREGYHMAVQSIGYNVPSFVKSLPLMKSEYKCTQTLDLGSNILHISKCSEEHVFRPFSYGKNGAMTTSEQTLAFTNRRRAEPSSSEKFSQRSTLLFQHNDDTSSKQGREEMIEAKLEELCQKAAEDIRPVVPEMINQLIEHMRQVDQDALSRVHMKINQKKICAPKADRIKQYFHDAIPMVGTAGSVGMIQDLISKKHVTGSEAEMWLLSLSFVHHPTKEMVAAATPLLGEPDVSGNALLAVSSLASSYCNVNSDCGKDSEISALIGKLMDLTNDCNAQEGKARRIVFTLRALGNIGHSHLAVSHLARCSTRRDVPEEIRIAAMDAFRRVPCDAMRSDLMGVFREESEDSEIRLNAYIALMKCPSKNILSEVREVLEKEKSNQVGSFVWTHLTNLMETSDPHMQDIRNIVQDEELKKEFNLHQMKFSRNYEGSFFLDSINTGAKVDSNVIFSEKSFIPRSANLNLTIDLFGHAINFLEFGGRVQGMERIMANFFGPTGMKEPKRKGQHPINFDKSMDDFRGSAFLRMFGNELRYWDDKSLNELQSSLRKLMNMQAISFSKTMQLLDSRMTIPTCVGLPLNLKMSATGSISLDAKASLKQSKHELNIEFKPSASVQVKGEMSVDAHVSKAGLKMVSVAHTSTGASLDIRDNKFDLQIPEKKMEIFNLKTDFYILHRNTEKKQKMIVDNVQKHEICTGNLMKQVTGLTFCQNIKFPNASNQNEAPFFPFTGPVVYDLYMMNEDAPNGYQIEGFTKQSPYSFYMDTPSSKVSRRIAVDTVMKNKDEAQITFTAPWKNVKIEGTVVNMEEMKKFTGQLSLDGRTDYTLNAELGMKNAKGLLSFTPKFEVTIPKKKMTYEGKIEMRPMKTLMIDMSAIGFIASDINLKVSGEIVPKEIGFTTQLRVGKKEYYIATRMGKLVSKTGFKYTPSLKITIPGKDLVEFTSEIAYESNKKMSFDFKLNKVLPKAVAMNAIVLLHAGKTKSKHIIKVLFKSPRGTFRINGDMDKQDTGITSRIIGSYNFGAKYSDHLTLSGKIRDLSVKKSVRYTSNIALASKKQQFLNFNLKGQLAKAVNHLETKLDLHYGNPKIKTNNLKFDCVLNRALKPISHTYDFTMAIQHPGQKIDYKMEIHHLQSAAWPFKKFENTMIVQSASENVVKTSLSYMNGKEKGLPCYKTEASLSYPGRDMKISEKVLQSGANSYTSYLDVQTQKGEHISIYSSYNKTRAGVYNIETIISLAGKKEIKFNGMVHATTGAYKSKVSMEADAGLISKERINYMAKTSIQYKLKATQVSTDASFEMIWAEDKKMSGSFNLKYIQGALLNSRLVLLTPYDGLKNLDSKIKWGWGKNKFTALVTSSLNNKINIKQDLSYTYPDFQMAYTSHVDFLGKTSDVVIVLGLGDSSFNGTMKIMKDKEIIGDISASYTGHKAKIDKEIQLRFTMMATSGKIEISTKFDPKKQMLESNGLVKLNLPLQELRQIGASYELKHNKHSSTFEMSYSSSLRNYKNGKMTIGMKRNLPKILKATMKLTHNGKSLFNINANYGNQKDNIDMKIDITEPNGQKITVSGDVNLAGSRKTGNVELKSNYINLYAGGAFEYQGTRSASGELKMTAEGKSVMLKADYKKEGSTYKVTGTLGLPDGRSLNMEGSLDLENIAASLKTMTPDFPELTEVDMAFSFNGDKRSSVASLKMMPYLDSTQIEMKYTKKQLSIEMKTRFESMKQVKVTVKFDGDWIRSQKVEAVFQLNNEKMVELDMNYHFTSINDFVVSMTALTSHRRYKEFQFDMMSKGPLSSMQSSLKVKFANVLMLDAMFRNSRKVSKVSLDAQLMDFDEFKSTFELKGNLDDLTAKLITSIAKKEVNRIDVSLKEYGRLINAKVNGPNAVNFDFDMKLDIQAIAFDMASTFTLNGREKYEMSASYEHLSKLQIKTSIPSYNDELLITFSGNMRAFNMQTKFSHNSQMYELMLSNKGYYRQVKGHLNTPYFQDTLSFRFDGEFSEMNILAQVMHNNDKFELTFSNKDYYRQLNGNLNTPYFQDTLSFKIDGDFSKMNILAQVMHNKDKFELTFSNKGYYRELKGILDTPYFQDTLSFRIDGEFSEMNIFAEVMHNNDKYELIFSNQGYYQKIDAKLTTPYFQPTLKFFLVGIPEKFNVALKIQFDKQMYEMKASNEGYFRQMNLMLDTPFLTCNSQFEGDSENAKGTFFVTFGKTKYDVTFTHTGSLKDMQTTLLYKLNGKEQFKSNLLIKGHGATITAIMKLPGTLDFEFESEWDMRSISFNLRSNLKLQKVEIYKIVATYEHMTKLQVSTSVLSYKGEVMMTLDKNENANMKLKLAHALTLNVMFQNSRKVTKVSVNAQLLDYDEWKSTFELKGNLDDMTAKLITSIAKKEVNRIDVSLKEYGHLINVKVNGPKAVNFDFNMDLDTKAITFSMSSLFTLNGRDKYEIFTSYEHLSKLQMKTSIPSYEDELLITFSGNLKAFNAQTKFSHNDQMYELMLSNKDYYRQLKGILNTPYFQDTATFKFDGELREMNIFAQVMHNKEKFELTFSNSGFYQQIDAILNTPYFQPTLKFSLIGNLKKFNCQLIIQFDKQMYEMKASNEGYYQKLNFMLKMPQLNCNFDLNKSGRSFNLNSNLEFQQEEIYKIVATYEHLTKLYIKTSFLSYNDELMMTLNGDLKKFNALAKLIHNTSKYELIISNQGYYRKVDAQLITPFFTDMASFILNGDETAFAAQATVMHDNDKYELLVSTRNYYQQMSISLSTPFSSDKLDIGFEGDLSSFESLATFSHNKVEYKLQVSNEGYYEKMNAKLTAPSFETEVVFTLKGNLQTLNSMAEFILNGKKFTLVLSNKDYYKKVSVKMITPYSNNAILFSLDGNLSNFKSELKFKHFEDIYEMVVSSSGYYRNLKAVLTTPFFEGSGEFSLKGNLQSFDMITRIIYNGDKFELSASTVEYYHQMKAELTTPYFKESVDFSLNGNQRRFNTQLTLKHNNMVYEMKASGQEWYRQMNFQLNSPFLNCGFQYSLEMAKTFFIVTIEEDKYELNASSKKSFQFNDISLSTPEHKLKISSKIYRKKKSTAGSVNVQLDDRVFALTGMFKEAAPKYIFNADFKSPYFTASLDSSSLDKGRKTPANQKPSIYNYIHEVLYKSYNDLDFNLKKNGMKMKFSLKGNLQKCKVVSSLKKAADLYEVNFSNQKYFKNINMEVSAPQIKVIKLSFNFLNNANRFDLDTAFSHGSNKYEFTVSFDSKTGKYELKCSAPQINVNGHFNGDLKSFSFGANAVFNQQKYELMASTKNYFRDISGKLTTPQFGEQGLSVKVNGQMGDFSGFVEVKNNNEMYRSEFSFKNQELRLSLPKWLKKLQVKLSGNWRSFEFIVQVMNYNGEKFEISATNKNFRLMKAHLTIPDLDEFDVLVRTSGNLRKGEATMKISFGEHMFENKVELSFDGRQANFEIEPQYMILGRSGKAKLKIDLMFEAQSYKYEFVADVEGTQVKSMASLKLSPEISVLMTVSLPTFDASEMKLRIVSRGIQKTDMMLNLKSPWTGMAKIFYEHNVQMGKSFNTKGYVEQDEIRLAGYSLDINYADDYSFDFRCDKGNSKNKIETKGDLKFQGGKTVATLSINTPFRVFREVFVATQTKKMRDGQVKAELDVKLPNQQYTLKFDLSHSNFNGLLNLNMDKKNKDKQYQFQTTYKNTDQRADVSRSFNFKMILPQRTVSLNSRFENTQHSMVVTSLVMWDEAKDQKAGFEMMVQKGRGKEGKLRIITPFQTIELFGRFQLNGNHYSTVGHIMMDETKKAQKINIKADMLISSDRADIDVTVKFPNHKQGMNLKTSINLPKGDLIFSSTSEFSMDQDPKKTFKMSTKLMSETKGKRQMYTLQMDGKHAESGFDTEVIGRVISSPDKYNADVEMGYLTSKRKQQKFAIRGEVHRLNREVNLKLEAPSKTIELDGSLTMGNRYMMSVTKKESGKENMEAVFKFNPKAQRMNLMFNYDEENPDNIYHIDTEIKESKAFFKAFRTDKKSTTNDLALHAELKPRILTSAIRWNPHLLQELNMFAYQKLNMYGSELKSFGYLMGQASDEVFIKFTLAKRLFIKDMAPISDYFATEYRKLSVDVAEAIQHMKQMFEQDYFYMKSAIESISNVWDRVNFEKYLNELKQEIENLNKVMVNKMDEAKKEIIFYYDQYRMQIKNETNELFNYYKEQYEMLYERAMGMKAEMESFMKSYPEKIKDLIDLVRKNAYGEKMIDYLMEIYKDFNEKTIKAHEHMETLTSSIYSAHATLNRHIDSVRHYPIVDAIMDAVDKVYQKALWSYNYWDVKENVLGLKNTLYKFGAKKVKEIKDIITDVGMNTLVFDPKRGEIIVEIRLGAVKYFYNNFMSSVEDIERAVMKLKNLMPSFNLNVWDIYYMMKPSTDIEDYIPPFKAEATLYAGKHITTFDGRHLIYKGTCSYLLAHDFVDSTFTVIANFDADSKAKTLKSLSVTTAHREQLEIFPDNKVSFNGRVAKLPLELTDATVTLQDNVIVVEGKRGYKVMCDHNLQLYTVQITGWYFNKVSGLFGNYNNEPKDDMLMSNNRYTNDLEQFAQSWSVSRQCKSHRNVAPSHMVTENKECAHFFLQTDSPFRYCFRQVNPDQFYKACAMQLSTSEATSIELCNVTSFYQMKCQKKGVLLSTPIMCPKKM